MPVLVMIAGPNGSGKTTLTKLIRGSGRDLGFYINPDEIALTLEGDYETRVRMAQKEADRLREACLLEGRSFCFETVMSHPSKIEILRRAKALGFFIVLYFVSTENPAINIDRVANRVKLGGHDVPKSLIEARYYRTMSMLPDAMAHSDQIYLFDNSRIENGKDDSGLRLILGITREIVKNNTNRYDSEFYLDRPKWVKDVMSRVL